MIAQVVQRLALDELAERLLDQGDVRFAEQLVDILGGALDDPVERQLDQEARRLKLQFPGRAGTRHGVAQSKRGLAGDTARAGGD